MTMTLTIRRLCAFGAGLLALTAAIAFATTGGRGSDGDGTSRQEPGPTPPAIPARPHQKPVVLRHAQRFELDRPTIHWWRAERPEYRTGWLLVLSVDADLVFRRELEEPVLYVGAQTAERVNVGYPSGQVVAIVPGDAPLAGSSIFFGHPGHPERVDAAHIARELETARRAGVLAPDADAVRAVTREPIHVPSQLELFRLAIDLVEVHSPQEQDLIRSARVPGAR